MVSITAAQLVELDACETCLEAFEDEFPAGFKSDTWTPVQQLGVLMDEDLRWGLAWAWEHGLLPKLSMAGWSLRGVDLRRANLAGVDLRGADLRGVNLSHSLLAGADLRGANLKGADLRHTDLQGAKLEDANLQDCRLHGAYVSGTILQNTFPNLFWPGY